MGRSKGTQKHKKWQTKFASKLQKSTWPQTSSWTPRFQLLPLPNSSTSVSKVAASALEGNWFEQTNNTWIWTNLSLIIYIEICRKFDIFLYRLFISSLLN